MRSTPKITSPRLPAGGTRRRDEPVRVAAGRSVGRYADSNVGPFLPPAGSRGLVIFPAATRAVLPILTLLLRTLTALLPTLTLLLPTLTSLLRETEEHHGAYEATAPKHHWSDWYSAYIVARERGRTPDEAVDDAAHHMNGVG